MGRTSKAKAWIAVGEVAGSNKLVVTIKFDDLLVERMKDDTPWARLFSKVLARRIITEVTKRGEKA